MVPAKFVKFHMKQGEPSRSLIASTPTPVLVLACNRSTALNRVLTQLFNLIGANSSRYPVTISHDCNDSATEAVARSFPAKYIQQPDQSRITPLRKYKFDLEGYHRLCRHYRWALDQVVNVIHPKALTVIILEDDLDLSPDLFDYFEALKPMLVQDENILCVSGFNDNGKLENVDMADPCKLWWTDFFPGLGWMTTTKIVRELLRKWPKVFWDDWLRQPQQRRGRGCIHPEVSKTTTFGKYGVSLGQFFDRHLAKIMLNKQNCTYNNAAVENLHLERYSNDFITQLSSAQVIDLESLDSHVGAGEPVRVVCLTLTEWKRACKKLNIMDDIRSGTARNSFRGAVPTFYKGVRVYVVPPTTGPTD